MSLSNAEPSTALSSLDFELQDKGTSDLQDAPPSAQSVPAAHGLPRNAESGSPSHASVSMQNHEDSTNKEKEILVPAELLNTLLAKVNRLESLEGTVLQLQSEVAKLRQNTRGAFMLFPKLPPELRQRIWYFAYRAPQIHVIHSYGASCSKINDVLNSCSEARAVGLSLKLDYFVVRRPDYLHPTEAVRNYVNRNVDTIWFSDPTCFLDLPPHIDWVCGKCREPDRSRDIDNTVCGKGCLSGVDLHQPEGSLKPIRHLNVEEVLFVVGGFEEYARRSDINFTAHPGIPPFCIENNCAMHEARNEKDVWAFMESDVEEYMKSFQVQQAAEREKMRAEMEMEGRSSFDDMWIDGLDDFSHWEIPKVKFVEVRSTSKGWVHLSPNVGAFRSY